MNGSSSGVRRWPGGIGWIGLWLLMHLQPDLARGGGCRIQEALDPEPVGKLVELAAVEKVFLQTHEEIAVASPAAGTVRELTVSPGAWVEPGQTLLALDRERELLEIERLENELRIIRKQAESRVDLEYLDKVIAVAQTELESALASNRTFPGLVPEIELNRLKLTIERSRADRVKTEFNLEILSMNEKVKATELRQVELALERRLLRAPVSGRVEELSRKQGEWLDVGQTAVKIVRLDRLRAEIKLPGGLVAEGLEDRQVVFEPIANWLEGQVFSGQIGFVESQINPVDQTVRVWALIDNQDLILRPGISGRVKVLSATSETK